MSKRKYKPIYRICSLGQFEEDTSKWYEVRYGNHMKMWHRSALESLQVYTLMNFIRHDYVYACEKIENRKDNNNEMDSNE